jgi:hypothetical protein
LLNHEETKGAKGISVLLCFLRCFPVDLGGQMETQEKNAKIKMANTVAHVIRTIGVLFFVAMAFSLMSWKYAIFAGTACMIIAPVVRRLMISGE